MSFELHPQLAKDTITLADWPLCRVLLMNDSQYPWFILVPRVAGMREVIDLNDEQQATYHLESRKLAHLIRDVFKPYKLNIAALGNMVEQLHVHHIARFKDDVAWPNPVWGFAPAVPYTDAQLAKLKEAFQP